MEFVIKRILVGWFLAFLFMTILWVIGRKIRNYAIVDVGWGLCISLLSTVFFILSEGNQIRGGILLGMILLWGIRLSIFLLFTRILKGHKDKRYATFMEDYGKDADRKFFTNIFQLQAFLALVLASPFLATFQDSRGSIELLEISGLILFFISITGETVCDIQLYHFKKNKANSGKVCQVGFWNYSRHPNYFFEWLIWVSFSLYSVSSPFGYFTILSPILMYIFLNQVSGVKLSEKYSLESKHEIYSNYQKTTSAFFIWFKKENI